MANQTSKAFIAAADSDLQRILDAIRAPDKEYLTAFYVSQRSKDVSGLLARLVREGEAETAVKFLTSDAKRFDTMVNKGQLGALMDIIEALNPAQQLKILKATESEMYGHPNATVIQNIVSDKNKATTERLAAIVRNFDDKQTTQLLAAPMAVWWMSSYEKNPLLNQMAGSISILQRERVLNSAKAVGQALSMASDDGLNQLFKKCKRTIGKPGMGIRQD